METKVIKLGQQVSVRYIYKKESLDFRTSWVIPNSYWCDENEISPNAPNYEMIQDEIQDTFVHIKFLCACAIGMYGEPTVEHIRMFIMNCVKSQVYNFFEEYHRFITCIFEDSSPHELSDYILLRDLLIDFEMHSMIPVDKELFEEGMQEEFLNYLYFIKQMPQHDVDKNMSLLEEVLSFIVVV